MWALQIFEAFCLILSYGKITDIGTNHFPVVDWFRINCGLISCNVVRCGLPFPWFGVVDPRFAINMFEGILCTKKIGVYTITRIAT